MIASKSPSARTVLALSVALLAAAALLIPIRREGWLGHDEGAASYPAMQVLRGERPHTDIQELYTGGLAFLHALFMRVGGESLGSIRDGFFVFTLLYVVSLFAVFRRFGNDWNSCIWTVAATGWSFTAYFAAIPSWYTLICGMPALACLLWFPKNPWMRTIAGMSIGFAFLAKITGVYFLIAAVLSALDQAPAGEASTRPYTKSKIYIALKIFIVICGCIVFIFRGGHYFFPFEHLLYSLPLLLVAVHISRRMSAAAATNVTFLIRADAVAVGPLAVGFLFPVGCFLLSYPSDQIPTVLDSVFNVSYRISGGLRQSLAQPTISTVLIDGWIFLLPLVFALSYVSPKRWKQVCLLNACSLLCAWIAHGPSNAAVEVQMGLYALAPVLTALWLKFQRPVGRQECSNAMFTLVCFSLFASLIQFPLTMPIYFLFHFGFTIALLFAFSSGLHNTRVGSVVGLMLAIVGIIVVAPGIRQLLIGTDKFGTSLSTSRSGLTISETEARSYDEALQFIRAHAGPSGYIFAGPDRPDIYFLSGEKAPRNILFDLVPGYLVSEENIPEILQTFDIHLAIVANTFYHRPTYSDAFLKILEERLPLYWENDAFRVFYKQENASLAPVQRMAEAEQSARVR